MDKQFQTNIDTTLTERHGNIISQFRKENHSHRKLIEQINTIRRNIEETASKDIMSNISELFKLAVFQAHIESKHLYTQGILDCIHLYHFLNVECVNIDYSDLFVYDEYADADKTEGDNDI